MNGEITVAVIRSELAPGDEVVLSGKRYRIVERGGQRIGVPQKAKAKAAPKSEG